MEFIATGRSWRKLEPRRAAHLAGGRLLVGSTLLERARPEDGIAPAVVDDHHWVRAEESGAVQDVGMVIRLTEQQDGTLVTHGTEPSSRVSRCCGVEPNRSNALSAGTGWFLAGYAGVAGFFALEAATRQRGTASALDASGDDRSTTRLIVAAYATSVSLAPLLRRTQSARLTRAAAPFGVGLQAIGLGLRWWSMRTLGRSYTRTLRTEDAQRVVDSGPYAVVRHPGYAGSLLIWTGFALTSRSMPVVVTVAALFATAYQRRIAAEEMLLRRQLPAYASYCERTKKLIPLLW